MKRDDAPIRPEVAENMKSIGRALREALPVSHGFVLLVFDYGDGGHTSYISSGQREDVVKLLREFLARVDS